MILELLPQRSMKGMSMFSKQRNVRGGNFWEKG